MAAVVSTLRWHWAAIKGFTGSLAFELEAVGVQVKLVEPGYGLTTSFTSNGGACMAGSIPEAYAPFAEKVFTGFAQVSAVTVALAQTR